MSASKPVIRELSKRSPTRDGHGKDRLHQLADNITDHLDNIVRQVRDTDKFDNVVTTRGSNNKTTTWTPTPDGRFGGWVDHRGLRRLRRGDNATDVGNLGEPGDDGGHLGAHRFFGDTPDQGIVPQISEPQPRRVEEDGERVGRLGRRRAPGRLQHRGRPARCGPP